MFPFPRVAKEDEGKTIRYVVVPKYEDSRSISVGQIVNPGCKCRAFSIVLEGFDNFTLAHFTPKLNTKSRVGKHRQLFCLD